jgi:cytochrome c553
MYNLGAEVTGSGALFVPRSYDSQSSIVGKVPPACGPCVPPVASATTRQTSGGHFAMSVTLCLCGCGREPKLGNKWINGHNKRIQEVSAETRRKLSIAGKGRPGPNKGKKTGPRPAWVVEKIAAAQRGKPHGPRSDEDRRKISEGQRGKVFTEQRKRNISRAKLGRTSHSLETREKLRIAHTGKTLTEEHRRKIGDAHRGEKSWRWRGGVTNYPYPAEWRFVKRKVHARDGRFCLVDSSHALCKSFYPDIHHIDANKENLDMKNLISLCKRCHAPMMNKEAEHAPRLRAILTARYGYVYD